MQYQRYVHLSCILIGALLLAAGCASTRTADVERVLASAGDNRGELERVLEHYRAEGDEQKLAAARFLIENMEGHGYIVTTLFDADENEIAFDALEYASFNEALKALDALEKEHGELDFKRNRFEADVDTITAAYLIENIDLAFQAWREKPWAKNLSFEAFCEHILPYRGSNEVLNPWRRACIERYRDLPGKLQNSGNPNEAAKLIGPDVHKLVRFSDLYYLHPTDQGFDEMDEKGKGRCEDITNMMMYAMRANGVACAADYTPFWADRDNNHAWEVTLDENGQGSAGLSNRAAKVYRKTFSIQRDSLACRKRDEEEVPRWLARKTYRDVTPQYMETTDVRVCLDNKAPKRTRFAYICVFNGGEWRAIHWGEIDGGEVTFTDMGRNIAYLPAYYLDEELVPAAPPFILTRDGEVRSFENDPDTGPQTEIEIVVTTPETPDADTHVDRPQITVKDGRTYELFVWDDKWASLGKQVAGQRPVLYDSVPAGGLLWLVEEDSRRLERIFTIEGGKQVWW